MEPYNPQLTRIGFFGLGAMGRGMARRLSRVNNGLLIWNRSPQRYADVPNAVSVSSPADLSRQCDIVVGCVLDDHAARDLFLSTEGLVSQARPGQVFIDHATFSPRVSHEIERALHERGAHYLDSPVTGGPQAAEDGGLTTMVGGDGAVLERILPVLQVYCSVIRHTGPSGSGLRLKLVNQLLVTSHAALAAEAIAVLDAIGIPQDVSEQVLTSGWADSTMLRRALQAVRQGATTGSGATLGALNDLQPLIQEQVEAYTVEAPVYSAAAAALHKAVSSGWGLNDVGDFHCAAQHQPNRICRS